MIRATAAARGLLLAVGWMSALELAAPSGLGAQAVKTKRGSVHAASRHTVVTPTPGPRRGPTVHHVHHVGFRPVHPWAYRAPTVWDWHPIGHFVTALAATAIVVSIVDSHGNAQPSGSVYYDEGVYYQKTEKGYEVIPPPTGAQIPSLPEGYTTVTVQGKQYAYYQGDFYLPGADGKYIVTRAPVGAIVPYIPDAATESTSGGKTMYSYNGVTYEAVSLEGETSYLVSSTG